MEKVLITPRGEGNYPVGNYSLVLAFGAVAQGVVGEIYSVAWGVVSNEFPRFTSREICGVKISSSPLDGGILINGDAGNQGIFDGPCIISLCLGKPPEIQWLRDHKIIFSTRNIPIYSGCVYSPNLHEYCGSNTQYGEFYLGRGTAIAAICKDDLAELTEELSRVRKRLGGLSSGQNTGQIPAAAARYSATISEYRALDSYISLAPCPRSVAEISAELAKYTPRAAVSRPKGRRPPPNLLDMRRELAEIDARLAEAAPILSRENPSRLAELEKLVPNAGGLPQELAQKVGAAAAAMPEYKELCALRAARDSNAPMRKILAERIQLEGRRGVLMVQLRDYGDPKEWEEYSEYKKTLSPRAAILRSELEAAKAAETAAEEHTRRLRQREELFTQCLFSAQAYGALTGAANCLEPSIICAQVAENLAAAEILEKKISVANEKRKLLLAPFLTALSEVPSGPLRAREYIAMAKVYSGAPCCVLGEFPPPNLYAMLLEYFPTVIVKKDCPQANYYVDIAADKLVPCRCGAAVRSSALSRHLKTSAHKKKCGEK